MAAAHKPAPEGELLQDLGPHDVSDSEAAALLSILQQAWDRKHGAVFDADVIDLNLVRQQPTLEALASR